MTTGLRRRPLTGIVLAAVAIALAIGLGVGLGPTRVPLGGAVASILDRLPLLSLDSGLTASQEAILWELRLPRTVLGMLVGGLLAIAGGAYQGVFRNPLADPYLLGVAAGAGLAATLGITTGVATATTLPMWAFFGALGGVALTYALGTSVGRGQSTTVLILAGVAVASFLTAAQTFVQQRNAETLREVYSWILGRLTTVGWDEVVTLLPYAVVSSAGLLVMRRLLDVLGVGDDEARALGVPVERVRVVILVLASLGTAAAVAASGLIAFVGLIVPHAVRLLVGSSYRVILPLSLAFGGTFLVLADLLARTLAAPSELPIGVVTAFFGAPFFALILRRSGVARP
jgi:iron complex transport system permease protein